MPKTGVDYLDFIFGILDKNDGKIRYTELFHEMIKYRVGDPESILASAQKNKLVLPYDRITGMVVATGLHKLTPLEILKKALRIKRGVLDSYSASAVLLPDKRIMIIAKGKKDSCIKRFFTFTTAELERNLKYNWLMVLLTGKFLDGEEFLIFVDDIDF